MLPDLLPSLKKVENNPIFHISRSTLVENKVIRKLKISNMHVVMLSCLKRLNQFQTRTLID